MLHEAAAAFKAKNERDALFFYRKALEMQIYNDWTGKLREGLTRLNEVQYPPMREMGVNIAAQTSLSQPDYLDEVQQNSGAAVKQAKR